MSRHTHKKARTPRRKKTKEPKLLWFGMASILLLLIGVWYYKKAPDSLAEAPSHAQLLQGGALFKQHCEECHGVEAKGGRPPISGFKAPALNGTAHAWHHPNAFLFEKIKNGDAGETPMLGFKNKLSDDEISSIIHYFQSLWPPEIQMQHAQGSHMHGG